MKIRGDCVRYVNQRMQKYNRYMLKLNHSLDAHTVIWNNQGSYDTYIL